MKLKSYLVIAIASLLILSPKPKIENNKVIYIDFRNENVVSGSKLKELDVNEFNTVDLVIDEWKTFADKVYNPSISEKFEVKEENVDLRDGDNSYNLNIIREFVNNNNVNWNYMKIISELNPRFTKRVYKEGLNITYGITQINVKLIPMATIYFKDFESNIESQLKFLDFYIDQKLSKGYDMKTIIQHYKYCNY